MAHLTTVLPRTKAVHRRFHQLHSVIGKVLDPETGLQALRTSSLLFLFLLLLSHFPFLRICRFSTDRYSVLDMQFYMAVIVTVKAQCSPL